MTEQEIRDLQLSNELLKNELGMLHSFIHGICMQMNKHGHVYIDGEGAVGIETGLFYSAALQGASLEEDYSQDIMWAVPAENLLALDQEDL